MGERKRTRSVAEYQPPAKETQFKEDCIPGIPVRVLSVGKKFGKGGFYTWVKCFSPNPTGLVKPGAVGPMVRTSDSPPRDVPMYETTGPDGRWLQINVRHERVGEGTDTETKYYAWAQPLIILPNQTMGCGAHGLPDILAPMQAFNMYNITVAASASPPYKGGGDDATAAVPEETGADGGADDDEERGDAEYEYKIMFFSNDTKMEEPTAASDDAAMPDEARFGREFFKYSEQLLPITIATNDAERKSIEEADARRTIHLVSPAKDRDGRRHNTGPFRLPAPLVLLPYNKVLGDNGGQCHVLWTPGLTQEADAGTKVEMLGHTEPMPASFGKWFTKEAEPKYIISMELKLIVHQWRHHMATATDEDAEHLLVPLYKVGKKRDYRLFPDKFAPLGIPLPWILNALLVNVNRSFRGMSAWLLIQPGDRDDALKLGPNLGPAQNEIKRFWPHGAVLPRIERVIWRDAAVVVQYGIPCTRDLIADYVAEVSPDLFCPKPCPSLQDWIKSTYKGFKCAPRTPLLH